MNIQRKLRKEQEEDLLDFMNYYLLDCSKTVLKIKEFVYSFVDISIGSSPTKKNFPTMPSVIAACKQNLDDLKRIESILRGYVNTKKQPPQQIQQDKTSMRTNTSPTNLQSMSYISEMLEVRSENLELREENKRLKQQIQKIKNRGEGGGGGKGQLKRCKSELFETNKNIELIRKRNRECLEMVRVLKEELQVDSDG